MLIRHLMAHAVGGAPSEHRHRPDLHLRSPQSGERPRTDRLMSRAARGRCLPHGGLAGQEQPCNSSGCFGRNVAGDWLTSCANNMFSRRSSGIFRSFWSVVFLCNQSVLDCYCGLAVPACIGGSFGISFLCACCAVRALIANRGWWGNAHGILTGAIPCAVISQSSSRYGKSVRRTRAICWLGHGNQYGG